MDNNTIVFSGLRARQDLLNMQSDLYFARKLGASVESIRYFETLVCYAIDRAWEAQCMAQGSL